MKSWTPSFIALALTIGGCSKPAQAPPTVSTNAPSTGSQTPSPPAKDPDSPAKPQPAVTPATPLTIPDGLKTEAFSYYGLAVDHPQATVMTVTSPDAKGKMERKVYSGVRKLTIRSVSEGKAEVAETETGGPEGDVTETVSISADGLYLEDVDPGKLKSPHQLLLPSKVSPGDTWKAHLSLDMAGQALDINATYKAVGLREISTKFGKKTALYVTDEGTGAWGTRPYTQKEEWWYVKGIGPVKNLSSESAGGKKFSLAIEIVG